MLKITIESAPEDVAGLIRLLQGRQAPASTESSQREPYGRFFINSSAETAAVETT